MAGTQGGFGAKLKIDVGTVLTATTYLLDVTFPVQEKDLAEATPHPVSGQTGYEEWVDSGLRRLTAFDAVLGWDVDEATHANVLTVFAATGLFSFSIEDPLGDEVIAFEGFIQSVGRVATKNGRYEARVRIQPSGAPTIT